MTSAPWPLWTIAIPPAFALMMLVGIYLYRRMNKRIDDHPVCRKCKFDLFGAPAGSARCPECGADVATKNAVVIGNRVSSVMGRNFATVLICVGLLGSLFVGREVYKRVNFQPIKPDWWLLMELNSKSFWMQEAAINTLFERIKGRSERDQLPGTRTIHSTEHDSEQ